jgi:FOG: CheY-like receiver
VYQTHESVREGCEILAATWSRHNIHCQIVDQADGLLPTKAAQTIVFLPHDEQSWNSFIKHLQFGEYKALNFNILISPFNKQDVQKRMGSSLPSNTSIIELPFTDTELISALSPHQLLLRKRTTEGLESKKWRTRRLLNKQVLVVDDDPISVEISQQILSDLGMNVVTASSGEQALSLCEVTRFDAILLDCYLLGISGYEVAEQLTQRDGWFTPIIALSADESPEASEKALITGMCQHLVKPATADEIIHTIDSHIHSGYVEINPTNAMDEFVSSMLTFYKTYSQRSVMSELLDIFHAQDNSSQL